MAAIPAPACLKLPTPTDPETIIGRVRVNDDPTEIRVIPRAQFDPHAFDGVADVRVMPNFCATHAMVARTIRHAHHDEDLAPIPPPSATVQMTGLVNALTVYRPGRAIPEPDPDRPTVVIPLSDGGHLVIEARGYTEAMAASRARLQDRKGHLCEFGERFDDWRLDAADLLDSIAPTAESGVRP